MTRCADGSSFPWRTIRGAIATSEIKTRLDDLGALERQLGWYERHAAAAARRLGWAPARAGTWLIGLASDEFERSLLARRSVIDGLFAGRAGHMLAVVRNGAPPVARSVAIVDPHSRRADWLIRTLLDGRRSTPPYKDYAAAARMLEARGR